RPKWIQLDGRRSGGLEGFRPALRLRLSGPRPYSGPRRLWTFLQPQRQRRRLASPGPPGPLWPYSLDQPGRSDSRTARQRWIPAGSLRKLQRLKQSNRQRHWDSEQFEASIRRTVQSHRRAGTGPREYIVEIRLCGKSWPAVGEQLQP